MTTLVTSIPEAAIVSTIPSAELFAKDRITHGVESAQEKVKWWTRKESDIHVDPNDTISWDRLCMGDMTNIYDLNYEPTTPINAFLQSHSHDVNSSKTLKKKAHMIDIMEKQFEQLSDEINKVVEAIREWNIIVGKGIVHVEWGWPRCYSER